MKYKPKTTGTILTEYSQPTYLLGGDNISIMSLLKLINQPVVIAASMDAN